MQRTIGALVVSITPAHQIHPLLGRGLQVENLDLQLQAQVQLLRAKASALYHALELRTRDAAANMKSCPCTTKDRVQHQIRARIYE